MKVFGFNLSFYGDPLPAKKSEPTVAKPQIASEIALSALTVKVLLEQAINPVGKIEILKLYEAGLSSRACPMSPALSNYILDISLNHEDKGVRRAARDVVIKTLSHDTILPAWDSNRDGQAEELTAVIVACLQAANDPNREHEVRFDAFTVAERIITRLPQHATEPVHSLLTSLAILKNHQLADKARVLLYYIEEQNKDEQLRDAESALRNLAARGKSLDLAPQGYSS